MGPFVQLGDSRGAAHSGETKSFVPLLGEGTQCRDCSMPTVTHLPALALMLEAGFIRSGKVPR